MNQQPTHDRVLSLGDHIHTYFGNDFKTEESKSKCFMCDDKATKVIVNNCDWCNKTMPIPVCLDHIESSERDVVIIMGEMGAGKTHFCREISGDGRTFDPSSNPLGTVTISTPILISKDLYIMDTIGTHDNRGTTTKEIFQHWINSCHKNMLKVKAILYIMRPVTATSRLDSELINTILMLLALGRRPLLDKLIITVYQKCLGWDVIVKNLFTKYGYNSTELNFLEFKPKSLIYKSNIKEEFMKVVSGQKDPIRVTGFTGRCQKCEKFVDFMFDRSCSYHIPKPVNLPHDDIKQEHTDVLYYEHTGILIDKTFSKDEYGCCGKKRDETCTKGRYKCCNSVVGSKGCSIYCTKCKKYPSGPCLVSSTNTCSNCEMKSQTPCMKVDSHEWTNQQFTRYSQMVQIVTEIFSNKPDTEKAIKQNIKSLFSINADKIVKNEYNLNVDAQFGLNNLIVK